MRYLPHTAEEITGMLDLFIGTMRTIAEEVKTDPERFHEAPLTTKARRMHEAGAAKDPCLTGCGR